MQYCKVKNNNNNKIKLKKTREKLKNKQKPSFLGINVETKLNYSRRRER